MLERCPRKTGPGDRFRLSTNLEGFLGEAVPGGGSEDSVGFGRRGLQMSGGAAKLEDRGAKARFRNLTQVVGEGWAGLKRPYS